MMRIQIIWSKYCDSMLVTFIALMLLNTLLQHWNCLYLGCFNRSCKCWIIWCLIMITLSIDWCIKFVFMNLKFLCKWWLGTKSLLRYVNSIICGVQYKKSKLIHDLDDIFRFMFPECVPEIPTWIQNICFWTRILSLWTVEWWKITISTRFQAKSRDTIMSVRFGRYWAICRKLSTRRMNID